ncbi:MAG: tetratricopeptide repeat protein [Candidatus Aminicenantes bacterium]|nr:tetratricopeptide repeat protein [Candidatus Aminicenantes bacterium]
MKKKLFVWCLMLFPFVWGLNLNLKAQEQAPPRYLDFDKITIVGHVYNENQQALAGIKVEIRLAYNDQQKKPEIVGTADFSPEVWPYLIQTIGTNYFAWAESDKEGFFRITGVPNPGAYFLEVRHAKDYFQTKVPVVIHKTGAKEFEADIILRARKPSIQPISKKALEEIAEAKKAVQNKNMDEAIKHFQKAIEIEPEFAEIHYNIGILLRQKGNDDEAVKHFVKAIQNQENYKLALFALGETLHVQKKYSRSNLYLIKYLEGSEEEESKEITQAHYLVGMNYFNLKQAKEAIPHLSAAIERDSKINPNAYILLANSYVIIRDGENAIKNYRKFVELYPNAPNIQQIKDILEKLESMYPKEEKKK